MEAAQYLVLLEAVDEDIEERRVCGVLFSGHLVQRSEEGCGLAFDRHRWRAAGSQREKVSVVESVEDPDVPPTYTTDERSSWRERCFVVSWAR